MDYLTGTDFHCFRGMTRDSGPVGCINIAPSYVSPQDAPMKRSSLCAVFAPTTTHKLIMWQKILGESHDKAPLRPSASFRLTVCCLYVQGRRMSDGSPVCFSLIEARAAKTQSTMLTGHRIRLLLHSRAKSLAVCPNDDGRGPNRVVGIV